MKIFIKILAFFIIGNSLFAANDTLFIDDAVKSLLNNNFTIRLSRKNVEIADNNAHPGNAGMLPTVDANASFSHNIQDVKTQINFGNPNASEPNVTKGSITKNTVAGVQMNWTLFDGLNMFISYDRLKLLKGKSEIDLQIAVQNMIRQFYSVYFQAVTMKKNLIAANESVQISLDRLNKLKTKEELGAAVKLEVLKAQVDLNTDSTNLLQAQLGYNNAKRDIAQLLGYGQYKDFEVQDNISIKEIEDQNILRKNTLDNNSSINQALKSKEISIFDKRRIQSSLFPRIIFNMGYNYNKQESNGGFLLLNQSDGLSIGVSAQMNLFNGLQTTTQIQNAEIAKLMNDISVEQIKSQIAMQFEKTWQNYSFSKEILNKETENLSTAKLNYDRTYDLYQLGQITSLELREAQRNLLLSEYRLNNSEYQVKLAETELLLLSNKLLNK